MNCCNNKCNQAPGCLICEDIPTDWRFPKEDIPPHKELASDAFYFIGFVLLLAVICLVAGIGWGLFERFYPSTACMVQMIFSINCK